MGQMVPGLELGRVPKPEPFFEKKDSRVRFIVLRGKCELNRRERRRMSLTGCEKDSCCCLVFLLLVSSFPSFFIDFSGFDVK
jgi:hypothetical protein